MTYAGVAPNANLISVKVSDETGKATVLDVIYGLQFAVEHQSQFNIRVINLSLDSTTSQSYKTDPLDAAVETAWMHGIVVVAAAGNQGNVPGAVQYSPANDPYVITVGGVDENGTSNPANDTIASWSSLGTTQDGFQKPDVYAPGAHIVSVLAPNSYFSEHLPDLHRRQRSVHPDERDVDGGPDDLGPRRRSAPDPPQLDARSGQGRADQPVGHRELFLPGAQRGQGGAALTRRSPTRASTPNTLVSAQTGNINYNLSSWSLSSWSRAKGPLRAGFALSSWSCKDCTSGSGTAADPSLGSWSLGSWSTVKPLG